MANEKNKIIVPMEGTATPNQMRGSMLSLASLMQLLSWRSAVRGDKRTAAAYAAIGMLAASLYLGLSN